MGWYSFRPYVSVAKRRANALRETAKLAKKGRSISPVNLSGRAIATTFWGKAWCENLEAYSDFANRLPRGRTYVRNGSVVDLQIHPGRVTALVSGSELYKIEINIKALPAPRWDHVKTRCAGQIASVVELLQGRLSKSVMEIITCRERGLFPAPAEIDLHCSCPDWADMCKHVAATLYGVGARLDEKPELLFVLRQKDHLELLEQAAQVQKLVPATGPEAKTIAADQLADVFGIELDTATGEVAPATAAAGALAASAPTGDHAPADQRALHPGRQSEVSHITDQSRHNETKKKRGRPRKKAKPKARLRKIKTNTTRVADQQRN